jgi:L-arabinose isomerase
VTEKALGRFELWFVVGSQHLYGDEVIAQVDAHASEVAAALDGAAAVPVRVVHKPVVTTPDAIRSLCLQANTADGCVGLVVWMHTFSPARMWIAGLAALQKPLLHLHTQFSRGLPWAEIDMGFMNLNQSAHGDREHGFLETRMSLRRKTVAGHWQDPAVIDSGGKPTS